MNHPTSATLQSLCHAGVAVTKSYLLRLCPTIAIGLAVVCQNATAQQPLQMPSIELSTPGVEQKSLLPAPAVSSTAFTGLRRAEALTMQFEDSIPHMRGAQDIALFREDALSVVLILPKNALGSGSLLQDNVVLTNFHVIDHKGEVTVVFKPSDPNGKPTQDEVTVAEVIKIDAQRDLALVRPHLAKFVHARARLNFRAL
jgi:S1-C subfamily serine protease